MNVCYLSNDDKYTQKVNKITQLQNRRKNIGRAIRNSTFGAFQGAITGAIIIIFQWIYEHQEVRIHNSKTFKFITQYVQYNTTENMFAEDDISVEFASSLIGLILFVSLQLFSGCYCSAVFIQSLFSSFIACNMVYVGASNHEYIWQWEISACILTIVLFFLINLVRKVNCCTLIPLMLLILAPFFLWVIAY
jgi:hypothetical protein